MTNHQDKWPICATEGCDHRIYLRPGERTVCAKCEQQGLAPKTEIPALPEPYGTQ